MDFISLDEAIHAIAARIGLPECFDEETRKFEGEGDAGRLQQIYLRACRYSLAAAVLHQCIVNSTPPPRWWSMHPDTGMAVINCGTNDEGMATLLRFARLIRSERENASNHLLCAYNNDGPFLNDDGLPRRTPRTIIVAEFLNRAGPLYSFQTVGLVKSELVPILDAQGVAHTLAPPETDAQQVASLPLSPAEPLPEKWIEKSVKLADEIGLRKFNSGARQITARNICEAVATELAKGEPGETQIYHGNQGPRAADAIRSVALKGWKFKYPSGTHGINGTDEIAQKNIPK